MYLPKAGGWHVRAMPVLPVRPGDHVLGSPPSGAATLSLLAARKVDEIEEAERILTERGERPCYVVPGS